MNHIRMDIPGRCVPCPRARVTRYGTHYPKRYTDWHDMAQTEMLRCFGRPLWEESVILGIEFYGPRPNADLDNLVKSVMDALTGIFIEDDRQVSYLRASRRKGESHTIVELTKLPGC